MKEKSPIWRAMAHTYYNRTFGKVNQMSNEIQAGHAVPGSNLYLHLDEEVIMLYVDLQMLKRIAELVKNMDRLLDFFFRHLLATLHSIMDVEILHSLFLDSITSAIQNLTIGCGKGNTIHSEFTFLHVHDGMADCAASDDVVDSVEDGLGDDVTHWLAPE